MADVVRTCTNCGNAQATGDFCEKCGTRLPTSGGEAATAEAAAAQATPQPVAPSVPSWLAKVFDLSFEGFVTRGSLKVLYVTSLVLAGVYFVLSFIFFVVMAARWDAVWCIGIFVNLFVVVPLMIGWTRVMLELTMTVSKLREDAEKTAPKKSGKA